MAYRIRYCWHGLPEDRNHELIKELSQFCEERGWEFTEYRFTWHPVDMAWPASRSSMLRIEQSIIEDVFKAPGGASSPFRLEKGKAYYPREFMLVYKDLTPVAVYPSFQMLPDGSMKVVGIRDFFRIVRQYGLVTPPTGFTRIPIDLHDAIKIYVADNLEEIFGEGWSLIDIEFPVVGGRIDILARNENTKDFMVIEIKTSISELDKAFGQVWRYAIALSNFHGIGLSIKDLKRAVIIPRSCIKQQTSDHPVNYANLIEDLYMELGKQTETYFIILDRF